MSDRLTVQTEALTDRTRVKVGFPWTPPGVPEMVEMAVLTYDSPDEAFDDAVKFVREALFAVRVETQRAGMRVTPEGALEVLRGVVEGR